MMEVSDVTRTEGEPHERLTRIADRMTDAMDADPEVRDTDKCIVFLDDGERAGMCLHGYTDDREAIVSLLMHLTAIFQANGMKLDLMTLGENGVWRG
jgi:hypothetical protein